LRSRRVKEIVLSSLVAYYYVNFSATDPHELETTATEEVFIGSFCIRGALTAHLERRATPM